MLTGMTEQTPQTPGPDQTGPDPRTRRQRLAAGLPTGLALALIAGVWFAGAVWSFEEQTKLARSRGFQTPELLPLVLDGMAVAMAAVAFAASLDARPAVLARLGTALAIACSAASNVTWAWTRSTGEEVTIALSGGVPVVSMLAFEVLLSEIRKQVQRSRGQAPRVVVTPPRMIRLALAPWPTYVAWRRYVLDVTDPRAVQSGPDRDRTPVRVEVVQTAAPDRTPAEQTPTEQTPAVGSAPDRPALTADPHRTPDPDDEPDPDQTPPTRPRRTPVRSVPQTRRPAPVRSVRSADDDEVLVRLRQWMADNDGRTPSLDIVQQTAGGGRSRAIRLRGLLGDDQTTDTDRAAV